MINIDVTKTGFQNVVDLIVANNLVAGEWNFAELTAENIVLEAPKLYDNALNADANTSVNVASILDMGFSGEVVVSYYRPTLDEASTTPLEQVEINTVMFVGKETPEDIAAAQTLYEATLKTAIATKFGLREEDFVFEDEAGTLPVPATENTPVTANIVPVVGSMIYAGAAFAVSWAAVDTDVPLDTVILNTALNGFTL